MNMKRVVRAGFTAGLVGTLLVSGVGWAESVSEGALLAAHCESCHGANGQGAAPNPAINGMDVADMVDIMKAFTSKEEASTMMYRHSAGYTDEQLKVLAEYFKDK